MSVDGYIKVGRDVDEVRASTLKKGDLVYFATNTHDLVLAVVEATPADSVKVCVLQKYKSASAGWTDLDIGMWLDRGRFVGDHVFFKPDAQVLLKKHADRDLALIKIAFMSGATSDS